MNCCVTSAAQSFRKLGYMLSGPGDLPGSKTHNFVSISSSLMVKLCMLCMHSLSFTRSVKSGNGPVYSFVNTEVKWFLDTDAT